ncbi:MAG: CocE/NonD family hydrolase [Methanobacteriota archaeon]
MASRGGFVAASIVVLSGCLSAAPDDAVSPAGGAPPLSAIVLSPKLPLERILEQVPIPASDGILLDSWVYRPDTDDPVPVIVIDSPYWKNLDPPADADGGNEFSKWFIDEMVPRGYAVVLKSVRGTGASQGCFNLGGLREQQDGYETVEFFAGEPWSTGKVGMIGKSYRGTTTNQAAITTPPHLVTIVSIAGISEWYRYMFKDGVAYPFGPIFPTYYQAEIQSWPPADPTDIEQLLLGPDRVACPDLPTNVGEGAATGARGDYDAYWQERDFLAKVGNIQASVYIVHGLQDWNVKPDNIGLFYDAIPSKKRMLLGQWDHSYPNRIDWPLELIAWFDQELKGIENGLDRRPAVEIEDNTGLWHVEDEWPPARAVPTPLYLDLADGTLEAVPADAPSSVPFIDNPGLSPDPRGGSTANFVVFSTPELPADLRASGIPEVVLFAETDRPSTHFVTLLYDVDPTGEWTEVNRGFLNVRHREDLRQGAPAEPGRVYELRFSMYPADHVFAAGHRVGLVVASSAPDWVISDATAARNTIHAASDRASSILLPIVADVTPESPAPAEMDLKDVPGN